MKKFQRLQYHFEPSVGWINDPNGVIWFQGQYHTFFQHYPYAPRWGQMHWGHAVSDDMVHWKELPIALYPDMDYENDGGCFSGSAIEKDGRLYLFYTSVSHELGQTQSVAWSDDGVNFIKYDGNPVIRKNPLGFSDFRDPKVTCIDGTYYMVVGTGDNAAGRVLLFCSDDLLHWSYRSVLFEGNAYAPCIECPDFFKMGDRYVLMFSKMNTPECSTIFVVGDFEDGKLVNYSINTPEWGPDFYAPQTFSDGDRQIMIGWLYHWGKTAPEGCSFAGALSIPRELKLEGDHVHNYPVAEASYLLKKESSYVRHQGEILIFSDLAGNKVQRHIPGLETVDILEDTKTVEVFCNGGEVSFSWWLE